jgi:Tol biopolymer transport system component/tRNA A-37 threonylcarbamoyl transferase component Bud32
VPISAGTRLGFFEIVAPLGHGAMGDVYRARDTRLDRIVAIKVLREHLASDSTRRARFEREARILSQLNHPHICALFEVGVHDGCTYLVLELLDGETLSSRLERSKPRPLSLKEALGIAIEIGEALDAAHRHGIAHRDLKPANVMLTRAGAKLFDFGIAKALKAERTGIAGEVQVGGGDIVADRHATLTDDGTLLGTVQYMAPEQIESRDADARSDIFAFGAVLYEMLTGRRAFDGETRSAVIVAVLDREPPLMTGSQSIASPGLARIVQKCLAKDPDRRWQSASDLVDALKWTGDAPGPPALPSRALRLSRLAIPLAIGMLLAAALGGAIWWGGARSELPPRAVSRFTVPIGQDQKFERQVFQLIAISPDGTQIVYAATNGLFHRAVSDLDAKPIPGTWEQGKVEGPVFSPDGRWLLYFSDTDRALKKVAVSGGAPVTLCKVPGLPGVNGISWGTSGIIFGSYGALTKDRGIYRISPAGGTPELLIGVKSDEVAGSPQLLPDNETVLFTLIQGEPFDRWDKAHIVVQSLKSKTRTTLVEGGSDGRYIPSGHIVYGRGGVLYALPFDAQRLRATGDPAPILDGIAQSGATGIAMWTLADNGTFLYVQGPAISTDRRALALLDRSGNFELLKMGPNAYLGPRLSPDGKSIAVGVDDEKDANIWVYDVAGTTSGRRLTFGGANRFPIWSVNGRRIVFQSDREGDSGLFWQAADGSGAPERLTKAEQETFHVPESISPDGEHLLFRVNEGRVPNARRPAKLMVLSLKDRRATLLSDGASRFGAFSPDGRWVAYSGREGNNVPVFVQPFPSTGAKQQVWPDALQSMWSKDGRELYAMAHGQFEVVKVTSHPSLAFSSPRRLNQGPMVGVGPLVQAFDIMPDGQHFVILTNADSRETATHIQVVLNWVDDLKQRMAPR